MNNQVVINFSGGRTSAFMVNYLIHQHGGVLPDNYQIHFQNTGKEMPETYNFVEELSVVYGVDVVWLEYDLDKNNRPYAKVVNYHTASRNGEPFDKLIKKRGRLPNAMERFCTSELKVLTGKRHMVAQGHKKWMCAVGFRFDEPSRVEKKYKDTRITPFDRDWETVP